MYVCVCIFILIRIHVYIGILKYVEFFWSSQEIMSRPHEYSPIVMDIARRNKLSRIIRCCQIMGRKEQDKLTGGQIFYPFMQFADIFFLKTDICQLGMDQIKVNVPFTLDFIIFKS
ncbi:putative tyrosine--tRNA ligase [Helianthus debilis subsp. tardiflorus]